MDYNAFVSVLQNWTTNTSDEFLEAIPRIVENACRTIGKEVDAIGLNVTTSVTAVAGSPYVALPSECYVIHSVAKTSGTNREFLKHRSYGYLLEAWPDTTSVGGNPSYYTRLDDSNLYIVPTPTSTQDLELRYVNVSIPSSANVSCYLLNHCPDLLLYACMVEANLYQMDMANAQIWQPKYEAARAAVANEARRNRRDDGTQPMAINTNMYANNLKNEA